MGFPIKQPIEKGIKSGLPLVFIDNVHFLNNSLDSFVKNLEKNDFYYQSQEFNPNALDLVLKKGFLSVIIGIAVKNIKKHLPSKDELGNSLVNV